MFGLYFGRYLTERGIVSEADAGDIADLQYPGFLDMLVDRKCITRDEAEKQLAGFKEEYDLDDDDISEISSGDLELIVPMFISFDAPGEAGGDMDAYRDETGLSEEDMATLNKQAEFLPDFVHSDPKYYSRFVALTIENVIRFITDKVVLKKVRQVRRHEFECLAYQELKGAHRIFLGMTGTEDNMLSVAGKLLDRELECMDTIAFDSICEFINCVNGLYASILSEEDIVLEIVLPHHYVEKAIDSDNVIFCLPVVLDGAEVEIVFSFDSTISII